MSLGDTIGAAVDKAATATATDPAKPAAAAPSTAAAGGEAASPSSTTPASPTIRS